MNNDQTLGQPDTVTVDGKTLHRVTMWLPLSWADETSYGKINNEEWLDREAARFKACRFKVWIHHDSATDTGALFSNHFYYNLG